MKYMGQCIESALNQDYDNYEIHAYDNGSTDGTLERLRELEKIHDIITVHEVPNIYENSYREAVDHCFQNLNVDYITFLSTDDYFDSSYLSKCIEIFSHNPEKIKCIQSGIVCVDEQGQEVSRLLHYYKSLDEFKKQCLVRSPVNSPSMVYHKSLYPLMNWTPYGGPAHKHHNIKEAGAGDYDTFCNFADNGVFIYPVKTYLGYYYRWHQGQCTWKVHEKKKEVNYDIIIQEYWKKRWTQ